MESSIKIKPSLPVSFDSRKSLSKFNVGIKQRAS